MAKKVKPVGGEKREREREREEREREVWDYESFKINACIQVLISLFNGISIFVD